MYIHTYFDDLIDGLKDLHSMRLWDIVGVYLIGVVLIVCMDCECCIEVCVCKRRHKDDR